MNYTAHYTRGEHTESLEFEAQDWAEAELTAGYNVPDSEGDWSYYIVQAWHEDSNFPIGTSRVGNTDSMTVVIPPTSVFVLTFDEAEAFGNHLVAAVNSFRKTS